MTLACLVLGGGAFCAQSLVVVMSSLLASYGTDNEATLMCVLFIQVTELVLDNCLCVNGEIEGLNDTFKKLEFLSMANVELSSLAKLSSLNRLQELGLSANIISGGLTI